MQHKSLTTEYFKIRRQLEKIVLIEVSIYMQNYAFGNFYLKISFCLVAKLQNLSNTYFFTISLIFGSCGSELSDCSLVIHKLYNKICSQFMIG